jgi:cytochrome c oxidase cbb3-type subunit 3/ubiquinol-cytochrome c reductase cytochrome c subunit
VGLGHVASAGPWLFFIAVVALLAGGSTGCNRTQMVADLERESRGGELYGRMCAVCHGPTGRGYAADDAPAIGRAAFLGAVTDAYLHEAIADGRTGTTMSSWSRARGGPLEDRDIDAIVAFMRLWPHRATTLDDRPLHGDAARGTPIYDRECVRCHGAMGKAGPLLRVGNPELLNEASDGFLRDAIANGRPGTPMVGFAKTLGEGGIDDVVALFRSWQAAAGPVHHTSSPPRVPPLPLGRVPLNPHGPEPVGFQKHPQMTQAAVIKEQLDHGARMVILDARAPSDYVNEHITGAMSVPFYDPSPYLRQLPKDAWMVCYCACPHAESGQLAQKLIAAGFKKVTVLDEGLGYWRNHQFGTRSGLDP